MLGGFGWLIAAIALLFGFRRSIGVLPESQNGIVASIFVGLLKTMLNKLQKNTHVAPSKTYPDIPSGND